MQTSKAYKMLIVLGIMLIIPCVLVFSTHLIMCQDFAGTFSWIFSMPGIAVFEAVLMYVLALLIYGLFRRLWLCGLIIGLPYIFLTLVSYFKLVINGTPLLLSDFQMIGQFVEIAGFAMPQISLSVYTCCAILIPVALCVILFFVDRAIGDTGYRLALVSVASAAVIVFLFTPLFSHWAVMLDDEDLFQEQRITRYGPFMGLYCTYAQGRKSGEIYTQDAVLKITKQVENAVATGADAEKTPDVIFLLSESFFDVAKLDNVKFKTDPIPNFHRLSKSFQSGEFISSTYCGGTGNVEMEVLTGICSNLLKEGDAITYLSEKDVYRKIPAISDVFKNYGYKTIYLHSYTPALYSREEIYSQLEFDKVMFDRDFTDPEYRGGYISDVALADKIIEEYEQKGDDKLFLYAVSMENHQPYMQGKFPKSLVNIKTDRLDQEEFAIFDSYITGIYDADKALGKLVRYFGKKKEPVMLVFFGDHLPNLTLNEDESVFTRLGYVDVDDTTIWNSAQLKKMLSTDYLIWTNYKDDAFTDGPKSSIFLGCSVLERLGLKMTDYYRWLSDRIMPRFLMYRSRLYVDETGKDMSSVPEADKEVIEDYAVGIYDIIYGDNRIFKSIR